MTDPWAGEAPSNTGSFLTWQQPHYIYMAEEAYRRHPDKATLEAHAEAVEATAEFMADFAKSCDKGEGKPIVWTDCNAGVHDMEELLSPTL